MELVRRSGSVFWFTHHDLLAVAMQSKEVMTQMDQHFKMKDGSVVSPERHLGANIGRCSLADGSFAWCMSSESYVNSAIKNVETWLDLRGERGLRPEPHVFFPSNWKPELDALCQGKGKRTRFCI
jgi:hypothetical protein